MTKRREFIKKSVIGSAGIAIGGLGFTSKSYASIVGANDFPTWPIFPIVLDVN